MVKPTIKDLQCQYMKSTTSIFRRNSRLLLLVGWALIFLSMLLNVWVIEFLFVPDHILEWPNTFYLYLAQILVGITGVISLIVHTNYDIIEKYFYQTELKELALHAFLVLLFIDILLQILFLLTVNHPGDSDLGLLYKLFHLDWEKNIPSTYSALQLILAGLIALYCMKMEGNRQDSLLQGKYVWLCVAIVLFYLGADEYFSFHEDAEMLLVKLNVISEDYDSTLGGYGYAWTIVGGLCVIGIAIPFTILFFRMFSNYRYLLYILLLSGGVFVLGAIGMENFQVYVEAHGVDIEKRYILMLEEFFEMLGVSIAIFVFIRYCGEIKISREFKT